MKHFVYHLSKDMCFVCLFVVVVVVVFVVVLSLNLFVRRKKR